jgi:glycosyltransferase involved in cell wall biosynthesis
MNPFKLVIVVPAYNEEEMLPISLPIFLDIMKRMIEEKKVSDQSRILFVNDGSKDNTWAEIRNAQELDYHVAGVNFSKNFGHQNALLAGLTVAQDADAVITIDADLQDDPNAIFEMVDKFIDGFEVVYGVRNSRETDSWFKRTSALMFYRVMRVFGTDTIPNHADFRLLSKRAVSEILKFKERNLFLRGMVPLVGFKATKVFYARNERAAGESKYPISKMVKFALDGITSFSAVPLRLIFWLGTFSVLVSLVLIFMTIVQNFTGNTTWGWSSLMVSIWFLGGAQLIALGILGEYLGKVFIEVKHRPRFVIEEQTYSE